MTRVVVGTDGSEKARAALEWAIEYARAHDAVLRVVNVWQYPYIASEAAAMASPSRDIFVESATAIIDEALSSVDTTGITVERVIREGQPARELLDEAKDADLLIVGSRGHGGFAGLLLGSVATQCARHPAVPTVIVPSHHGSGDRG
jgi:nucleotide-binding universal stress UspA family protein